MGDRGWYVSAGSDFSLSIDYLLFDFKWCSRFGFINFRLNHIVQQADVPLIDIHSLNGSARPFLLVFTDFYSLYEEMLRSDAKLNY